MGQELWVVATPIGNLEDLSPRAQSCLEDAQAILCEDTRRTAQLSAALGFSNRLERLDAHATAERIEHYVERLKQGEKLALVTDAGTPGVSDPAAALVSAARAAGIKIVPIPGPSAVTALLSVCGFGETAFVFRGFFPRSTKDREKEIQWAQAAQVARVFIWFESPQRILEALEAFQAHCPQVEIVVGKELTKIHEKIFAGAAQDLVAIVKLEVATEGERGEWCFAVLFPPLVESDEPADETSSWFKALRLLIDHGIAKSEAARQVSQSFGVQRNRVYEAAMKKIPEKNKN